MILSAHYLRRYLLTTLIPIYPGVPLVSYAFSGFQTLAIPRSVSLKKPEVKMSAYLYYRRLSFQVSHLDAECHYYGDIQDSSQYKQ